MLPSADVLIYLDVDEKSYKCPSLNLFPQLSEALCGEHKIWFQLFAWTNNCFLLMPLCVYLSINSSPAFPPFRFPLNRTSSIDLTNCKWLFASKSIIGNNPIIDLKWGASLQRGVIISITLLVCDSRLEKITDNF